MINKLFQCKSLSNCINLILYWIYNVYSDFHYSSSLHMSDFYDVEISVSINEVLWLLKEAWKMYGKYYSFVS